MLRSFRRQSFVVALALLTGSAFALVPRGATAIATDTVAVIVRSAGGSDAAAGAVRDAGGRVTRDLAIVDGVAARVPASSLDALAASGVTVTPDGTMTVAAVSKPKGGAGSGSLFDQVTNATKVWQAGDKGAGQTVALIDTGITDVPDISSRVVSVQTDPVTNQTARCENLSGESGCTDTYGHGTFIAGLVAGTGAASNGIYMGVAPAAKLVSVKVAGRSGAADVSTVLAAIQWVVSFKDTYHITVLNLSLGTDSKQSWKTDPLNYAVEKAWAAGIVVVVSASNRGPASGTISKPGDDPWVVTVGAIDDRGTVGIGDDALPNFSGRGPTADGVAKPDLVAPGAHVVSLTSPGSAIDTQFPSTVDSNYRKGSGTSMATGIVSGVVALMRSAHPGWTPDRVKYALKATARPAASTDQMAVGKGEVDAYAATYQAPSGTANKGLARSSGTGSLALSRGTVEVRLTDPLGTVLDGSTLYTAQLLLFDPTFLTGAWTPTTWYASPYATNPWFGSNWEGSNWEGSNWEGATWDGQTVAGTYGSNWEGSTWYGAWDTK